MAKVICMSIKDFLIYGGKAYLLDENNIFFNPHGSYKPKAYAKNEYNIGKIHVRIKTPESLADKVIRYLTEPEKKRENIVDLIGIRIILDKNSTERDCYRLYEGLKKDIFSTYNVIEEEDYINEPKPDTGFRSLKIGLKNDSCFEVQIRTKEMHDRAMRDQYYIIKFQNGKNDPFFLLLSNLFSARYL